MRNFTLYYHAKTNTLFLHFEWVGHWYAENGTPASQSVDSSISYATTNDIDMNNSNASNNNTATETAASNIAGTPPHLLTPEEEQRLFQADMQAVAANPIVESWWAACETCQEPFVQWPPGSPPPSRGNANNSSSTSTTSTTTTTPDWWAPLLCLGHCGHWPTEYSTANRDPDFVPQFPAAVTPAAY
jgi:L-rhamnose mutarotase